MKRIICVEPIIKNGDIITSIFNKYNPDSSFINPHVCLVFPFESNLNKKTINELFNKILKKYNSFNIQLQGISTSHE